jgi:hypothetical protein
VRIAINQLTKQLEDSIEQSEKLAQNIEARVEEHAGVFYVYNAQDESFIAQGRTVEELREHINRRSIEGRIFITKGDNDVIQRLKTNIGATTD